MIMVKGHSKGFLPEYGSTVETIERLHEKNERERYSTRFWDDDGNGDHITRQHLKQWMRKLANYLKQGDDEWPFIKAFGNTL